MKNSVLILSLLLIVSQFARGEIFTFVGNESRNVMPTLPTPITRQPVFATKNAEIWVARSNLTQRLFSFTSPVTTVLDGEITPGLYSCIANQATEISKFIKDNKPVEIRQVHLLVNETNDKIGYDHCNPLMVRLSERSLQFAICYHHETPTSCRMFSAQELKNQYSQNKDSDQKRVESHKMYLQKMNDLLETMSK